MSEKVRLIFRPEVPPPLGYIPQIDMMHPLRPAERLLPEIIVDLDENGKDAFFFDLDPMVARHILERDVCYQLWAPAEMKIVVRDARGAHMVTARSVNPAIHRVLAKEGELLKPKAGVKAGAKEDPKPIIPLVSGDEQVGVQIAVPKPSVSPAEAILQAAEKS